VGPDPERILLAGPGVEQDRACAVDEEAAQIIKVAELHCAPWVKARQEQLASDVRPNAKL
jgi:hypothetical protein